MKKIVIGISGASGAILGIRLLEELQNCAETHLIITDTAKKIINLETGYTIDEVTALADYSYCNDDLCTKIASGSFRFDCMVIVPCSIKSLSAIAMSYSDSLLVRVADVAMKERRRLILSVREMPFHEGHLESMQSLTRRGVIICPPVLTFYNNPATINDLINSVIGKLMDLMEMPCDIYKRWMGATMFFNEKKL